MTKDQILFSDSELAWSEIKPTIQRKLLEAGAKRILEVGAGANPLFDEAFLRQHQLQYTALDISATELAKAPDCYHKIVGDICDDKLHIDGQYDFVFSRMLAEHVKDGRGFHQNILRLLAPGGRAFHFFPTLWALPFIVNRLLPEGPSQVILNYLQRDRHQEGNHAKFPALYSWCRGPTEGQLNRMRGLGYEIEEYIGFFGHRGYYVKIKPLLKFHDGLTRWLLRHPVPHATSYAYATLRKPLSN